MPHLAYVIAGSEATGGAGIQADLKTFQALGTYGMGALTCIVSFDPNNNWDHRFDPIDPGVIADQIEAATSTHNLDTVKVGMLGTPETIDAVAASLTRQQWRHIVLDPVLICKGQEPGQALDTDNALKAKILPLATVITPNMFETSTLAGMDSITSVEDLAEAAKRIYDLGPAYVVAKGGVELAGPNAVDVLYDGQRATAFSTPKIGTERPSGAGCTFAAAITAELAKGRQVGDAVKNAKAVVARSIEDRLASSAPFDSVVLDNLNLQTLPTVEVSTL